MGYLNRLNPLTLLKCSLFSAMISAFLSAAAVLQYIASQIFNIGLIFESYSLFSIVFLGHGALAGPASDTPLFVVVTRAIVIFGMTWGPITICLMHRSQDHETKRAPSKDYNERASASKLLLSALLLGGSLTLLAWSIAFGIYYPSDSRIKYNYMFAFIGLLISLLLRRFHRTTFIYTLARGLIGSAITLAVAAFSFTHLYPEDNYISLNYGIALVELLIGVLLTRKVTIQPQTDPKR